MSGQILCTPRTTSKKIGGRRDLNADIDRLLAVEADLGFVVLGAERDVGDVLQADDRAVRLA